MHTSPKASRSSLHIPTQRKAPYHTRPIQFYFFMQHQEPPLTTSLLYCYSRAFFLNYYTSLSDDCPHESKSLSIVRISHTAYPFSSVSRYLDCPLDSVFFNQTNPEGFLPVLFAAVLELPPPLTTTSRTFETPSITFWATILVSRLFPSHRIFCKYSLNPVRGANLLYETQGET